MSVMSECQHNGCSIFHIMEMHHQSTKILVWQTNRMEAIKLNMGCLLRIMAFDHNVLICLMITNSIIFNHFYAFSFMGKHTK